MKAIKFVLLALCVPALLFPLRANAADAVRRLLYVAVPGIRNETAWGGIGILVYDIDHGHKLIRRIPTLEVKPDQQPEAIKGICASAKTGRLYFSTTARLVCMDLRTDRILWNRTYPGGCDRMGIAPDGSYVYLPTLEGPSWHVIDGATGDVVATVETGSGSHNTVCGLDGGSAYLAGLKSPLLTVTDAHSHKITGTVGPFSNVIRPFTVNGKQTRCFVNVNNRLGFEVGDLQTGKVLYQVDVRGMPQGPVKRHGCPSHGIGLTPDEKELWLSDGFNQRMHIFDATKTPPVQKTSVALRDQPGWVTFSLNGRWAYPSTGEVINVKSHQIAATLSDENGKPVQSEKLVEIDFEKDRPVRAGDQFGLGRKR